MHVRWACIELLVYQHDHRAATQQYSQYVVAPVAPTHVHQEVAVVRLINMWFVIGA